MKSLRIFFTLFTLILAISSSYAQDSKEEFGEAVKNNKSRGQDPNIESNEQLNIKGETDKIATQPSSKGGNARGGNCYAHFDNYTKWRISCYVDGNYEGTVAPYGDGGLWVGSGMTKMYSVIYFNDGSTISYGPASKYCGFADEIKMKVYEDSYVLYVD